MYRNVLKKCFLLLWIPYIIREKYEESFTHDYLYPYNLVSYGKRNCYFWWKHIFRLFLSEVITLSAPQGKLPYSLLDGLIPSGLKINKCPAFESVTDDFENQWNSILYEAEKRLVKLLLKESENVVAKVK